MLLDKNLIIILKTFIKCKFYIIFHIITLTTKSSKLNSYDKSRYLEKYMSNLLVKSKLEANLSINSYKS